nr:MAG TPA: Protein of unknown function (DUF1642) [Caudoviricetes sp.]
MNKQELIKHIEDLPYKEGSIVDKIYISRKGLLELVKQLDEPQKPVMPQFVVDWIKYCKNTNATMTRALLVGEVDFYNYANQKDFSRLKEFLETESNQETFVLAWIYGYEVEKEKQYYIRLKGVDENYNYLNHIKHLDAWCLTEIKKDKKFRTTHTRKELEDAGFGEVFDSPLFEVEEVTE